MTVAGLSGPSLAVLGGLAASALIALYLVGRNPRRVVVPFVPLWVSTPTTGARIRRTRRLQRVGSLLVQVSILSTILVAAADPIPNRHTEAGRTIVMLMDRSASMRALDEPGSRLARARTMAIQLIDGLAKEDRALMASFAAQVSAASPMDVDRARLKAAVESISVSDEPGDLGAALRFAVSVLRGQPHPTLVVIGDGGGPDVDDPATLAALENIDVRFLSVGKRSNNVGLVSFSARRLPADPSSVELVLVSQSFRGTPADVHVTIATGAARRIPVARRVVHLEPGARVVTTVSGAAAGDGQFEAHIENANDDLVTDDQAFAAVPPLAPLSVLVLGVRNLYLDGALMGMGADVRVTRRTAEQTESTRARWEQYDVVVFDGVTPEPAPQRGRYLYLDPHGASSPWPERGNVTDPVVTDVMREHPLVKQLGLTDLNVATARRLSLQAADVAVAAAPGTPLIIARARPSLREVAVAFDVRRSDLPLRSTFPLFLGNALSWLARPTSVPTVALPGARVGRQNSCAAESDLTPRGSLRLGARVAPAPDGPMKTSRREWWRVALLLAIGLATVEWFTFHRRITV